ncbi:MAG TPA: hypothetical protein VN894_05360 [Polyangiaceae bacterium]|nr:hypothetical protein [Polyangiaceae bacterium]
MTPLLFVACSAPGQDAWNRARSPASARSALAAIQTRDRKVTWLAGQTLGIEDARGNVIADGVTTGDLERIDPFLHAACTNAMAGPYLDARSEPPLVGLP